MKKLKGLKKLKKKKSKKKEGNLLAEAETATDTPDEESDDTDEDEGDDDSDAGSDIAELDREGTTCPTYDVPMSIHCYYFC